VHRGCFNRAIATLITENEALGCHQIPAKFGKGTICLCDTELCNSADKAAAALATMALLTAFALAAKTLFL
jgi:hypothetical protein